MIFGLTWEKLLLLGLLAAILIGPERLPRLAEQAARFIHGAGEYLKNARTRLSQEMGPEMEDVDWRKLDPRQYDPRRIIRDALFDEPTVAPAAAAAAPSASTEPPAPRRPQVFQADAAELPYDDEAT